MRTALRSIARLLLALTLIPGVVRPAQAGVLVRCADGSRCTKEMMSGATRPAAPETGAADKSAMPCCRRHAIASQAQFPAPMLKPCVFRPVPGADPAQQARAAAVAVAQVELIAYESADAFSGVRAAARAFSLIPVDESPPNRLLPQRGLAARPPPSDLSSVA